MDDFQEEKMLSLRELMVSHMNNLAVFPIVMAFLALLSRDYTYALFLWIPMGFVPYLFYLLRTKIDGILLLFLIQFLIVGAVGSLYLFTPCGGIGFLTAFLYMVYSVILSARTYDLLDSQIPVVVATGLSVVVSVIIAVDRETFVGSYDKMIALGLILYFGLYFFNGYIEKYCNFIRVSKNSAGHIPAKEIFSSGSRIAGRYSAVIVILLLYIANVRLITRFFTLIRELILYFVRFLMGIFFKEPAEQSVPTDYDYISEEPWMYTPRRNPDSNTELILGILSGIAVLILLVIILGAATYAVQKIIHFLKEKSKEKEETVASKPEDGFDEIKEKCPNLFSRTGVLLPDLKPAVFLSPAEKIRRYYKRFVKSNTELLKPNEPGHLTAREATQLLRHDDMAAIYEKARYSKEECTGLDYVIFKELAKRKKEDPQVESGSEK